MDTVSPQRRSKMMSRIRSKNTVPEMRVRRLLHGLGFRYRLHRKDVLGKPDIVFMGRRKAIFIHGCFWHQHAGCKKAHIPLSRQEYWEPKLSGNRRRDEANIEALTRSGWEVLVLWECETEKAENLAARLIDFLTQANP